MPVITLVIYFGASEWDGPICIHDMLNANNKRLLSFVPDYRINLIAPAQVPDEDFEKFSTDFRDVLQFIKCSKDEEALSRLAEDNERFVRMNPETAELINLITDSKLKLTVEEGTVNMCQAIQQMRERSKADGMVEGRLDTLVSLVKKNRLTLQEAAEEAEMTVDEFVKKTGIKPLVN